MELNFDTPEDDRVEGGKAEGYEPSTFDLPFGMDLLRR
jgi:hypothetical protein